MPHRNGQRIRSVAQNQRGIGSTSATVEDCPFLAVFRDTDQNLAAEPFSGEWRQAELRDRARALRRLNEGTGVAVYGVR